jgi:hypothetical protein
VLRLDTLDCAGVVVLLKPYGLRLRMLEPGVAIPESYWGESEAGLRGNEILARPDTPLHSLLHEACHYICAAPTRRAALTRDAGGDVLEECAVCYLQILLANQLPDIGADCLMKDMDDWGYSFRLGSARSWFRDDAADARSWLQQQGLIDEFGWPTGALRC